MEDYMLNRKLSVGKFQNKLISIMFIPMVNLLIFNFFFLFALYSTLFRTIQAESSVPVLMQYIQQYYYIAIIIIMLIFILTLFWIHTESSKMVGAFERLIKELDEFDLSKQDKIFHVRKNDTFAKEIANRINKILGDWVK